MYLDGYAAGHGMGDLLKMRLDRFLNFVYWWCTRNIEDEAELRKFEARLWRPPAGVAAKRGPWSADAETAAFAALKAATGA